MCLLDKHVLLPLVILHKSPHKYFQDIHDNILAWISATIFWCFFQLFIVRCYLFFTWDLIWGITENSSISWLFRNSFGCRFFLISTFNDFACWNFFNERFDWMRLLHYFHKMMTLRMIVHLSVSFVWMKLLRLILLLLQKILLTKMRKMGIFLISWEVGSTP